MAMDPHAMTRTMTPSQQHLWRPLTSRHRRPFSAARPRHHRQFAAQRPRSRASGGDHTHASHLQNGAGSDGASANGASQNGAAAAAQPVIGDDSVSSSQVSLLLASALCLAAPVRSLHQPHRRCMLRIHHHAQVLNQNGAAATAPVSLPSEQESQADAPLDGVKLVGSYDSGDRAGDSMSELDARIQAGVYGDVGSTKDRLSRPLRQVLVKDQVGPGVHCHGHDKGVLSQGEPWSGSGSAKGRPLGLQGILMADWRLTRMGLAGQSGSGLVAVGHHVWMRDSTVTKMQALHGTHSARGSLAAKCCLGRL